MLIPFIAILALFFGHKDVASAAEKAQDSKTTSALRAKKPEQDENTSSGGLFKVSKQRERPPEIEISNSSQYELRLDTIDSGGALQSLWVPAGETKRLSVKAGSYSAQLVAVDDPYCMPTNGAVVVQDFHHYEADFHIVSAGESTNFYIGD